ncbi:MAG: sulfotransferase [Pseudomonadota bacterium]
MAKPSGGRPNKSAGLMRKAIAAYEAGDLERARKAVTGFLKTDPHNPDGNHLAGVIALKAGRPAFAVDAIRKALARNPRIAMAHNNLGEAYRALEEYSDAEAAYRAAIELEPRETGFQNNLGTVLTAQDRTDEAIAVFEAGLARTPNHPMLLTNYGNALLEKGRAAHAVAAHEQALRVEPGYLEAKANLGLALLEQGDLDRAETTLSEVIARDDAHVAAIGGLAKLRAIEGRNAEAVLLHERQLDLAPGDRDIYLDYADMQRYAEQPEAAADVIERHRAIAPDEIDNYVQLGSIWRAAGEKKRAEEVLREAITRDPDHVPARMVLAQIIKHTPEEENLAELKRLEADDALSDGQRANLSFGLGKALEDIGDHTSAGERFITANRLRRATFEYDEAAIFEVMRNLAAHVDTTQIQRGAEAGSPDATPIFIVGMPRSGTSLVEQIISSHSDVRGAGELTTFGAVVTRHSVREKIEFPEQVAQASDATLHAIGEDYVEIIRRRFGDAPHITDKMPHNFLNVGYIRMALPNARIVHCRRHPMDTCLSIFKNAFSTAHEYAYDMAELGRYYRAYTALMAHWRAVCGEAFYDLDYEKLVADTEGEARALLAHCKLDWQPQCLEFYKTKRTVNTVSAGQVRQPIYTSSVALWKRYGAHLAPLIDALGDLLDEDERSAA